MENPNMFINDNASTSKKPEKKPLSQIASAHNEAEEEGEANAHNEAEEEGEANAHNEAEEEGEANKPQTSTNFSEKKDDSSRSPSNGLPEYSLSTTSVDSYPTIRDDDSYYEALKRKYEALKRKYLILQEEANAHNEAEEEGEANKPQTSTNFCEKKDDSSRSPSNGLPEYSLYTTSVDNYPAIRNDEAEDYGEVKKPETSVDNYLEEEALKRNYLVLLDSNYEALKRKYLLLQEETCSLEYELKQSESDVKKLKGEKHELLDKLVVLEGLVAESDIEFDTSNTSESDIESDNESNT